jgi:hypothetical protein
MGMMTLDEPKRCDSGVRIQSPRQWSALVWRVGNPHVCMNRFPENLFLDYPVESTEMNRIRILPTKFAFKDHFILKIQLPK